MNNIIHKTFVEIDLNDPFFTPLKVTIRDLKNGLGAKRIRMPLFSMKMIS